MRSWKGDRACNERCSWSGVTNRTTRSSRRHSRSRRRARGNCGWTGSTSCDRHWRRGATRPPTGRGSRRRTRGGSTKGRRGCVGRPRSSRRPERRDGTSVRGAAGDAGGVQAVGWKKEREMGLGIGKWFGWKRNGERVREADTNEDAGWRRASLLGALGTDPERDELDGEVLMRSAYAAYRSNPM